MLPDQKVGFALGSDQQDRSIAIFCQSLIHSQMGGDQQM
jgi:hypothetical protein